jgi:hypothetical protein
MTPNRLRAPSTDGGLLVDPPADRVSGRVKENRERLTGWDYDFQGRTSERLRVLVRQEVAELARRFLDSHGLSASPELPSAMADVEAPLIVTGHQPELFHPGVWVKNFAVAGIARQTGGVALNLIVDNDIPKLPSVRVPVERNGRIFAPRVEFDRWQSEIPYEDLHVHDRSLFASFGGRVSERLREFSDAPIIDEFWPRVSSRELAHSPIGIRFSVARRQIEAEWGVTNLEVPLGQVCQTDGFYWFVSHILAHLPRFQRIYNDSLVDYRRAHGIRSKNHPVAALANREDWREAPFWVWSSDRPRRRALLARQLSRRLQLRIDGDNDVLLELPLHEEAEGCCAVERLRELPAQSIRLRTRALTTTMFSRFLLGDLFIHGIGGAKYDELGDEIARRFFGIEPPGYVAVSLTTWLNLPRSAETDADQLAIERQIRDLKFNPDRHIREPFPPEARILLDTKREAIAERPVSRFERRARFRRIRDCNQGLQPFIAALSDRLIAERIRIFERLKSNRLAKSREYASVLFSERRLRAVLEGVMGMKWG